MDALKIVEKIEHLEIMYEPIYSADEHIITGYEVIPHIQEEADYQTVDSVVYANHLPIDLRIEWEHFIMEKAIVEAKNELPHIQLYIPCNPNLLMHDIGEGTLALLQRLVSDEELHHITFVLKEHLYEGDIKTLHNVVRYFKTYGISFALSDVSEESHLENILYLEPSVIKLNIKQLNYNKWGASNPVFSTIRTLAFKMGASLLIEDIETSYQLHQSWKNGARYYKGGYFDKPSKSFGDRYVLKERFQSDCEQFISTEHKILEQKYEQVKLLEKQIFQAVEETKPNSASLATIHALASKLSEFAFRLYICNEKGFQVTPNIVNRDGKWIEDEHALGKNWSWRPYFLLNLIRLRHDVKADITNSYVDIETNELTRTFSLAIGENEYLFIDISYAYLYKYNIVR